MSSSLNHLPCRPSPSLFPRPRGLLSTESGYDGPACYGNKQARLTREDLGKCASDGAGAASTGHRHVVLVLLHDTTRMKERQERSAQLTDEEH